MTDLDELERLLKAATPGPWVAQRDGGGRGGGWWSLRFGSEAQAVAWKVCTSQDAAFIAAANPQAILALLDRCEALEDMAKRALCPLGDEPNPIGDMLDKVKAECDALKIEVERLQKLNVERHKRCMDAVQSLAPGKHRQAVLEAVTGCSTCGKGIPRCVCD